MEWRVTGETRGGGKVGLADHGWCSEALKCSICFNELTIPFLRTQCDHLLCRVHACEDNGLPHRCPACKKGLGIKDLTEQDPAFFKSDDEMREFAKRLRPEEAFQLSAYAVQFHVKQKQLETVIEARKRARAEKSENKHRMYTKTVADELNAVRPEVERLSVELERMERLARELHEGKQEAEDKLAQVNARLAERLRAPLLSQAQQQQYLDAASSPIVDFAGARGYGRVNGGVGSVGNGDDAFDLLKRQQGATSGLFKPRPVAVEAGGLSACSPTAQHEQRAAQLGLGQSPRVNKRLQPGCDASPRLGWGADSPAGAAASYQLPPRAGFFGDRSLRGVDASQQQHGLLNPNSTTPIPADMRRQAQQQAQLQQQAQQAMRASSGAGGARGGGAGGASRGACDSPLLPGPSARARSHADPLSSFLAGGGAGARVRF